MSNQPVSLSPVQRALLTISAIAVYALHFWPATQIRNAGLTALGMPQYAGFKGMFLPHLLLYSTFAAVIAAIFWFVFVRAKLLPTAQLEKPSGSQLRVGVVGGLVALVASLIFVYFMFPRGTIHWIDPDGWKIAGNVFSNFYEEFVFRGFVLVALCSAIGFWPAAIIASAMWGTTHGQYPISLQVFITAIGIYFSWLARRTRSLWAPYTSHMVLDVIADCLIG